MKRMSCLALASLVLALVPVPAGVRAQTEESPAAAAARKRLQQKISLELKETGFRDLTDEIKREMDKAVSFKIDNTSGISNNSKVSITCKDKTVEQILNELADRYEFGWYVVSNPKDRYDGWVLIRKHKEKERGYEAGKEPKKKAAASGIGGCSVFAFGEFLAASSREIRWPRGPRAVVSAQARMSVSTDVECRPSITRARAAI
jgi:hypothetical protein